MGLYQYDSTEDKLNLVAGSTNFSDAPVGAIFPFGGTDIPISFLLCDGSAVSRTDYEDLFAVIGTAFGTGDGSTTFNLPDLREAVPKGAGLTGKTVGNHLDADGLAVGEFLDDRIQDHTHALSMTPNYSYLTGEGNYKVVPVSGGTTQTGVVPSSYRNGDTTEVKSVGVNYIIKAKQVAVPADFASHIEDVAQEVYGDIIPSDASASNKLVTHQTPYESFTLNNNSGTQKWYKLGTYMSGNNTARLDFVSARVDGQMFESSIRISGNGVDNNYVSWIGESGCEISTIQIKVDTNRNIYVKMNSYSAVELRIYGTFTLSITELVSEPSGADIVLEKLVKESNLIVSANGDNSTAIGPTVSSSWEIISNGLLCICYGINTETFNATENTMISMQLPSGYVFDYILSANVFLDGIIGWYVGASHKSDNGAGTYITRDGIVNPGSFRQIVLAHRA